MDELVTPEQIESDPLGTAITVLSHITIDDPSVRPDTEDAHNRVQHALGYLRLAVEQREQKSAVWEALREWREVEESPVRRGFEVDDAKLSLAESWSKYLEQREKYERMLGRRT